MDVYREMIDEMSNLDRRMLLMSFISCIEFDRKTGWHDTDYSKLFLAILEDEHKKATAPTVTGENS